MKSSITDTFELKKITLQKKIGRLKQEWEQKIKPLVELKSKIEFEIKSFFEDAINMGLLPEKARYYNYPDPKELTIFKVDFPTHKYPDFWQLALEKNIIEKSNKWKALDKEIIILIRDSQNQHHVCPVSGEDGLGFEPWHPAMILFQIQEQSDAESEILDIALLQCEEFLNMQKPSNIELTKEFKQQYFNDADFARKQNEEAYFHEFTMPTIVGRQYIDLRIDLSYDKDEIIGLVAETIAACKKYGKEGGKAAQRAGAQERLKHIESLFFKYYIHSDLSSEKALENTSLELESQGVFIDTVSLQRRYLPSIRSHYKVSSIKELKQNPELIRKIQDEENHIYNLRKNLFKIAETINQLKGDN